MKPFSNVINIIKHDVSSLSKKNTSIHPITFAKHGPSLSSSRSSNGVDDELRGSTIILAGVGEVNIGIVAGADTAVLVQDVAVGLQTVGKGIAEAVVLARDGATVVGAGAEVPWLARSAGGVAVDDGADDFAREC